VDLREKFAYPLPLRVINELMGVPEHLIGPLRKCVDGIFDIALSEAAAVANYEDMIGLLQHLVEYRRGNPAEDMTSTLISISNSIGCASPSAVTELMALVAGAFAAIRHANAESSAERSAHLAQIILDGLRPQPR
jgi:cytochrome P450